MEEDDEPVDNVEVPPGRPTIKADQSGDEDAIIKHAMSVMDQPNQLPPLCHILAFSPNDKYLVSGGLDGSIIVWEVATERCIISHFPPGASEDTAEWTQDTYIASPTPIINAIAFSPVSDPAVFVYGTDGGSAILLNITTNERRTIGDGIHTDSVKDVSWSSDNRLIATVDLDSNIRLWDSNTLQLVRTIEGGYDGNARTIVFSPDGHRIASASSDYVQVWDVESGEEVMHVEGHEGPVWKLAFEPSGRRLATCSEDGTVHIWNTETGEALVILRETGGAVWNVVFAQDGSRVCAGLMDGSAVIFDSFDGSKICTMSGDAGRSSMALGCHAVLTPDGTQAAIPSGSFVALCDADTGNTRGKVEHSDNVCAMQISHDGCRVAAAGEDGQVHTWLLDAFDESLRAERLGIQTEGE